MRSSEGARSFITSLASQLAEKHHVCGPEWLGNEREQKAFKQYAKYILNNLTSTFKQIAQLTIKDAYHLRPALGQHGDVGAFWEQHINELFVDWNFTDALTTIQTGELFRGFFSHPALATIIVEAVWPPTGKLYRSFPSQGADLDKLIAFSVTIARWALDSLKAGRQKDFSTAEYRPIFNLACQRIDNIRDGHYGPTQLLCLDNLVEDLIAMGTAYHNHYQ
ncbi:hypothetical protein BJ138DRAFT_1194394 [Hygrophoropsis aurantiaca]|uniref:Uncharacterized protein n=1 Tax=Hygrophoropsis aurantiaca TaxID=72124 RepID=A0ACB8AAF4_9AGAM|nr:hypothetical protein BJ138DRAFT_1194394 [Hygrophoropsis aurantiaca]